MDNWILRIQIRLWLYLFDSKDMNFLIPSFIKYIILLYHLRDTMIDIQLILLNDSY